MAEDTTLATARAAETADDEEISKAELQRRMEQARETITQTVTEIKDTVANQYQSVKETINETLDWREQFRKRPVAFSVGALSAGFIVGYSLAAAFKGGGNDRDDYPSYEESDVWNVGAPLASAASAGRRGRAHPGAAERSYAAQAITGGAYGSTEYAEDSQTEYADIATDGASQDAEEEPSGPGLIERFKETKAFDRLQGEVSKLGDRFIDQLSTVGQEVVLPALFGKIKELFGVDLSGRKQASEGKGRARSAAAGATPSSSSAGSQTKSAVSDMGGMSYGTSENRGYNSSESRDDYGRSSSSDAAGGSASDTNRGPQ
jgi:hypothetical protein